VNDGNETEKKIKVVDRRWFNEQGHVREDRPAPRPAPAPEKRSEVSAEQPPSRVETGQVSAEKAAAGAAAGHGSTSPLFVELVATLGQQAEMLLSGVPGYPKEPEQAKRLIDYLGVLETKTRGNLSLEEEQILSNVLFQLRALYVQASR
jgi:hypothetical protein